MVYGNLVNTYKYIWNSLYFELIFYTSLEIQISLLLHFKLLVTGSRYPMFNLTLLDNITELLIILPTKFS